MKSIKIRNRWTGSVVFEYTKERNTIAEAVLEAIRCDANLRDADLRSANLRSADLSDADLHGANLCGADLSDAKGCYLLCPTEGSFIGWKKSLWAYRKITNSGRCAAQFGNGTQMPLR